jgi:mRNA interferase RelE/StbE
MKIELSRAAERSLGAIDTTQRRRITAVLARLAANPADPSLNIAPIGGEPGVLRLRVGGWRILYRIDAKADTATVALIRRRGDVYKR